ncbi:MAG: manganese efflux pump MntP family protein [Oscillospiraceae bacterium]|nr:manganese efflux pump MntP family protein [Oscillospiraceae bacterium]
MDYREIVSLIGIAVGLSMDAFAVSIANGAVTRNIRPAFALKVAGCFGAFQAFMPVIGWLIGKAGESFISAVDHWIALILLSIIGIQMLREAHQCKGDDTCLQDDIPLKRLLTLAVATSIDALATGILLPSAVGADTWQLLLFSVCLIGLITFALCYIGIYIGKKFGDRFTDKAQIIGGLVLIGIGVKIFVEHMWFS